MKQITLHVYQSIDGCPVRSDKYFDAAVDASGFVLIDEETYLRLSSFRASFSLRFAARSSTSAKRVRMNSCTSFVR